MTCPFPAPISKVPLPLSIETQEDPPMPWQFLIRSEPYVEPELGGGDCLCGGIGCGTGIGCWGVWYGAGCGYGAGGGAHFWSPLN